ncbi:uncharacterized protein K452DRAFT_128279 [Aplosporella prunicola CBS 121167]|uniref:Uncharacterized protein n=1 Tax=Aplosporella prunicola CBS 121167 TaxID=1176127 RepID=A0A6A6AX35_9PEZI|nr:uncharacterized protein K452DRAFT_128279 [Aplosporella prunicola CBS 121167]KAF2136552.1 hypothetical protein K452DRAFT_128279 [Aplosporella prunicola CBS 121167]
MAGLALKALSYGAEKIPDRFFEAIPGGYFRPKEDKHDSRRKSKSRSSRYRSQSEGRNRKRSPYPEEYSDEDSTDYDHTDEESDRERRRHRHRHHRYGDSHRAREGRRRHRSLSEDRDSFDDGYILPPPKVDMSRTLGGQHPTPYFPPPPVVGHAESAPASTTYSPARPHNPADYSPAHPLASSEQPSPHSLPLNTRVPAPSPVVPQHVSVPDIIQMIFSLTVAGWSLQ